MTSQPAIHNRAAFKFSQFAKTFGFIIFCFAIGEMLAVFVTSIIFATDTRDIFIALSDPLTAQREVLLVMVIFSGVFRFLIAPGFYLLITDKRSLSFLTPDSRVDYYKALTMVALFISVIPCVSFLIEINSSIRLPAWLSEVEMYFKQKEIQANMLARKILSGQGATNLTVVVIVVAIVPGIVEEFFFRGIVQTKLYKVFANPHYAVLISSALFSFFHFQFYGFIPRMALGVLLGYVFLRSRNIWYSVIGHITINLSSVLFAHFIGPQILDAAGDNAPNNFLLIPSIALTAFLIWKVQKVSWNRQDSLE